MRKDQLLKAMKEGTVVGFSERRNSTQTPIPVVITEMVKTDNGLRWRAVHDETGEEITTFTRSSRLYRFSNVLRSHQFVGTYDEIMERREKEEKKRQEYEKKREEEWEWAQAEVLKMNERIQEAFPEYRVYVAARWGTTPHVIVEPVPTQAKESA